MFLRFFGSLKLAIFLLIALLLVSAAGTFLPISSSSGNVFRSPVFLGCLFLLGLNLSICTLVRLGPKARRALRPSFESNADRLLSFPESAQSRMPLDPRTAASKIKEDLRRRAFRIKEEETARGPALDGRKKTAGLFGSDIVHLGLLVVMAGGIVSGLAGFRTTLALEEGRVESVPKTGLRLRLDRFDIETYDDGSVKDWKSSLAVLEDGREAVQKTIEVNHPLAHKGFRFYQSGYAPDREKPILGLAVVRRGGRPDERREFSLRPGQPASLGEEGLSLRVARFEPDFFMNERGEISSRSEEPRNPAVLVEISRGDEIVQRGWVFARHPEFDGLHERSPKEFEVGFVSLRYDLLSLIEAARDPGAPCVWIGCGLVMVGLFLAFYWPAREIRVLLEPVSGGTRLTAAAVGRKNREGLAREFRDLFQEWKKLK